MKLKFREIDPTTGDEQIVEQEFTLLNSAQYAEHVAAKGKQQTPPAAATRKPTPPVPPTDA